MKLLQIAGQILKLENSIYVDSGATLNDIVTTQLLPNFSNGYNTENWYWQLNTVRTHKPNNTTARSPGTLELTSMIENIMQHIAAVTGQDPIDVRLANMPADTERRQFIKDFRTSTNYETRKTEIDEYNTQHRWKKRGIALRRLRTKQSFQQDVDLAALYMYNHNDHEAYNVFGIACAEIELDVLTGNFLLTRVDILQDTGESMNPLLDNHNVEEGTLRAKAVGEPTTTVLSIVVLFAIRYALNSARSNAGNTDTWYNMGAPSTIEEILLLTENRYQDFHL
ncbi:hypothetical protein DMENIID0001_100120 [Sergentomyia squamirostris]